MFSFKTRSYFEGIWNAIRSVDFIPREWDTWDSDLFIVHFVNKAVETILPTISEESKRYKGIKRLGEVAREIDGFVWIDTLDKGDYDKLTKEFSSLLAENLTSLWF